MRRFVDLHTHSTASDGQLPPAELIRLAEGKKLAAIALTDHDTTDGLAAARAEAARFPDLRFIGGIEISARCPRGVMHILGLGLDERSPALRALIGRLLEARNDRNPRIVQRLQELGLPISMEDVRAQARRGLDAEAAEPVLSRAHIAQVLWRKRCVKTIREAFDRYIGLDGPAYVDKERLEPAQAIEALHQAGAVAVLAHPPQMRYANSAELERILRGLIRHGLDGIEVYHSDHTPQQARMFLDLARKHNLLVTGGSDFHGSVKPDVRLGLPRVPKAAIIGPLADRLLGRG